MELEPLLDEILPQRKSSVWTPEKLAYLEKRRAEGAVAAIIANELGVTRNAILGQAYRMGYGRPNINGNTATTEQRRLNRNKRERENRRRNKLNGIIEEAEAHRDLPPDYADNATDIMGLKPDSCRWPTKGWGADMIYCGGTAVDGCPYCARHYLRSIQPRFATSA